MTIRTSVAALSAAAPFCACATNHAVVTTGSQQARETAQQEQKTADQYRAPEAARQAQQRADDQRARSEKKPDSFLDWFVETLFASWPSTQASGVGPGR
jgi:hypothetical protein